MYGGVSLAIYINGVAQELLKLVRATAPDDAQKFARRGANELKGSEKTYRKLGQLIARGAQSTGRHAKDVQASESVRTRFVIDILSGSSAGGINALYLAKALVNDLPIDKLKELWIKEGDIGLLINDRASTGDIAGLEAQDPPRSLLNSDRMYWKLLEALNQMDTNAPSQSPSPNVGELDLYITATDMAGQVIKLQLADGVARERRYRQVFHFRYSDQTPADDQNQNESGIYNDFKPQNNPFLAFAARCTSAHPAAFDPMKLSDIDGVLSTFPQYRGRTDFNSNGAQWQKFYEVYQRRSQRDGESNGLPFWERSFSDGGTLDNAPFQYVIDTMPFHQAYMPVDRKLLYIEPVPGHPERIHDTPRRPTIFENAWHSLSTLPRVETIREDLERVLERNRLLERVNHILSDIEDDVQYRHQHIAGADDPSTNGHEASGSEPFYKKKISDLLHEKGIAWGGYQRLRIATVTDDLALLITRVLDLDEISDELRAVRSLVRAWRRRRYDDHAQAEAYSDAPGGKHTEIEFLFRFDILFRLRRLRFVLSKIDELACLDQHACEIIEHITGYPPKLQHASDTGKSIESATSYGANPDIDTEPERFRQAFLAMKTQLSQVDHRLQIRKAYLWQHRPNHELLEPIRKFSAGLNLEDLLKPQSEQAQDLYLDKLVADRDADFTAFSTIVDKQIGVMLDDAAKSCQAILGIRDGKPAADALAPDDQIVQVTKQAIRYYYENFDDYDMITYPILYATDAGDELDQVEVFRISPEDATNLEPHSGEPKLAGTAISNFGAFFKKNFRVNDIMWGRLDGAERIISALLPNGEDQQLRQELIDEAQREIVIEEYFGDQVVFDYQIELRQLLQQIVESNGRSPDANSRLLATIAAQVKASSAVVQFRPPLAAYLRGLNELDYFRRTYTVDRRFETQAMVQNIARASKVFGKMLEGYAEEQRFSGDQIVWVTRLAQLFWVLVEVAVPGSLRNLIFRHWIKLLYFFEVLMILLGTLLINSSVQQFGFLAFGLTLAIHAAVLALGDVMTGERRWANILKYGIGMITVMLATLGIVFLLAIFGLNTPRGLVTYLTETRPAESELVVRYGQNLQTFVRGAFLLLLLAIVVFVARVAAPRLRRPEKPQQ